jgi:hypothetical protein
LRIVKASRSDNFNQKLKTPHFGQSMAKSKHDPSVLTGVTRAKAAIRRVMVPWQGQPGGPGVTQKTIGGNTNYRSSPAAQGLTDNPNPKYNPSDQPGAVSIKRKPIVKVENATRGDKKAKGHGSEIDNPQNTSTLGQKINKR